MKQPRPDRDREPQVVQAPVREALDSALPGKDASAPPRERRSGRTAAGGAPDRAAGGAPSAPRTPAFRPVRPKPAAPHRTVPSLPAVLPDTNGLEDAIGGDVCAAGRKYGGWRPGSPEARICERTYG
ncbi:hypothetical protein GUY61_12375 [Streptomyces sp. GC420]|nr:hypothetical protein [Streptomyces sp. GC420]